MQRLFVDASLAEGAPVGATEAQAHYLGRVMRLGVGDAVVLFNGRDGEWHARIADLQRNRATLVPESRLRAQSPGPDLWLAFAVLKRDATDLLVRQATELGVGALLPVFTERTNAGRVNADRLRLITHEAAEQCERLDIPDLRPPVSLPVLLDTWPADRVLAAAIERSGPSATRHATALLIGPEGGFAPRELDALRTARFVSQLSLGPRVLRAETAAIAGLALLQAKAWST